MRRRDGTLRAYVRHQVHDDPYRHVGRQDLTAHVDVTAVERAAHAAGLTTIGITTQAEALMGLGIEARLQAIQADPATTFEDYTLVRSALMRLLDPAAMGRFRVMAFGRDWPAGTTATGAAARACSPSASRSVRDAPLTSRLSARTREDAVLRTRPPERHAWPRSFCDRTAGEWGAILHARSARSAPLAGARPPRAVGGGRRRPPVRPAARPVARPFPRRRPPASPGRAPARC